MVASRLGPTFDPLRNRGVPQLPFIYIGFVKRNDDAQRMGRLSVWIPEIGGDPKDESSWIIASYASPFAGATDLKSIPNYMTNSNVGQQSYGMWMVPPDLNNEVAVFFANGDLSRAYWFACTYQQNMNHMVPGIASNVTTEPSPPIHVSPVIEYNKAEKSSNSDSPRRPVFHPLTDGLNTEGLTKDNERGSSSTSARREAPSQVFGFLSPRGNTVHIDDNDKNEFIRLRTRSGAQVLIHETTGYVYINSKNGNAWLEISDAGIDAYSANSVSIRANQDLNIRADRNIIFDAGASIEMRAGKGITMDAGTDIAVSALNNINLSANVDGSLKATRNLRLQSGNDTTMKATGIQARDGRNIFDNNGQSVDANAAEVPQGKQALDSQQTYTSGAWNWRYGSGHVNTIVGRMPTHEPWGGHPNSNVPPPPTENVPLNYAPTYGNGSSSNTNPDGSLNDTGCSLGVGNTKPISNDVYNAISNASSKTGVDMATMLAFADIESSFQPGVGAKTSSAAGLYQFTNGTWNGMVNKYGNMYNVSADSNSIYDPNANALMGGQFIKDNTAILQSKGIANPTPGQLYIMHFMGSGGGPQLISAAQSNPNADASAMFPAAASANPSIFRGKTVGQVYESLTTKVDSKAAAYANQYGLPPPCERSTGVAASARPGIDANNPGGAFQSYIGKSVGSGQCVDLVKATNGLPNTAQWSPGQSLAEHPDIPIGTPIATFDQNGKYGNHTDGTSHAAVFLGYNDDGSMKVLDQWSGHPAQVRNIQFNNSKAVVDNGYQYRVINVPATQNI